MAASLRRQKLVLGAVEYGDAGRAAGSKQEDTIREMKGRVGHFIYGATQYNSGVLKVVNSATKYLNTMESTSGSVNSKYIDFDASLVVDTSDENRPINYAQPVQIYLGRYKTEVQ